ncbi:hypothetical protein ACM64Y_06770 [Novispirillum sp. DQ9]|uniref:hypothetical protein n=1 Tax=Novispirillum sp. DQ9 TaxID=3398612 RepID=UPI003C7C462B
MSDLKRNHERPAIPANLYSWNDRHAGQDIFIIGAGPQLAFLTDTQVEALGRRISIGGNNTFYKVKPTYFLSAYQIEVWKALRYMEPRQIIHMRLPAQPTDPRDVNILNRTRFNPAIGLPRFLTPPVPALHTVRNQALAMMHLALVMGARRVVTIGVDQTNYAYFWQYDDSLRAALRQDMHRLQAQRYLERLKPEERDAHLEGVYERLGQSAEDAEKMPFYEDLTEVFSQYVNWLAAYGCEVVTTTPGSVLEKAGAHYLSLDDALDGQPVRPKAPAATPAAAPPPPPAKPPKKPMNVLTGATAALLLRFRLPPGPVLVAAAPGVAHTLGTSLRKLGFRMGSEAVFGTLCSDIIRIRWAGYTHERVQWEPLWDFPEPLVEILGKGPDHPVWQQLRDDLAEAFANPTVRADLKVPPAQDLARHPGWGWTGNLELALVPLLRAMFPALRLIYLHDEAPLAGAAGLRAEFQAKTQAMRGLKFDEDGLVRGVGNRPPRQMQVLQAPGSWPVGRGRFTMRCETLHGAEELLRTYHLLGRQAVQSLGPDRAAMLSAQELRGKKLVVVEKLKGLLTG